MGSIILNRVRLNKIIFVSGLFFIAVTIGIYIAMGENDIVLAVAFLILFLVFLFLYPKMGIWGMPLVAFFSPFDPLGIGFSPEKILMAVVLIFWLLRGKGRDF